MVWVDWRAWKSTFNIGIILGLSMFSSLLSAENYVMVSPRVTTSSVAGNADDCAIWVHPKDPVSSVIFGNDKTANGGIYAWDLKGRELTFLPLSFPINIDTRSDVRIGEKKLDLLVTGQRNNGHLHFYAIEEGGKLQEITSREGVRVYSSKPIYGLSLYKAPRNLYLFISFKGGIPIEQYKIIHDSEGKITAKWVRSLGHGEIHSQVEGMVVDDQRGILFASDEDSGVLKFDARLEGPSNVLMRFAIDDGISGDREGLTIMDSEEDGKGGYLILSSQGNSTLKMYQLHEPHNLEKHIWLRGADHTDGLAACHTKIEGLFPWGFVVCHNSSGKNFAIYAWEDFMPQLKKKLERELAKLEPLSLH